MPTCTNAKLVIVDRGGDFSGTDVNVRFEFKVVQPLPEPVIAQVEILDGADPNRPTRFDANASSMWKILGSCKAGGGRVIRNNSPAGERLFLITKVDPVPVPGNGANSCCRALELVMVRQFTDFTLSEIQLYAARLFELTRSRRKEDDCAEPTILL